MRNDWASNPVDPSISEYVAKRLDSLLNAKMYGFAKEYAMQVAADYNGVIMSNLRQKQSRSPSTARTARMALTLKQVTDAVTEIEEYLKQVAP